MISKVIQGKTFRGCCRYVINKPGSELLFSHSVRTDSIENTIEDFNIIKSLKPNCKSVVIHTSLSFAYEDSSKLNNERLTEIGKEFLKRMKLDNHQSVAYRHTDAKHVHFHIITNRISLDGIVAKDNFIKNRAAKISDELEVDFNLTVAKGHRTTLKQPVRVKPLKIKNEINNAINDELANNPKSLESLKERLKKRGVDMEIQIQSTGRVNGVSFSKDGIAIKGSAIDKRYSYKNLQKTINQSLSKSTDYENER